MSLTTVTSGRDWGHYGWLVLQVASKDFKMRYTHSWFGYAWSVVHPLAFFLLYYVVFTVFVRLEVPSYPLFLLLGMVVWTFFSEGSNNGAGALLARSNLITKSHFPREVIVYAALLNAGSTFIVNLAIFFGFFFIAGPPLRASAICFPLLLVNLVLFTAGAALFLAPLQVRFRDTGYLWKIVLDVGFWITPIVYLDVMVPQHWMWLVWLNPIARIIGDARRCLVYGLWPGSRGLLLTSLMSIVVFGAGYWTFRRMKGRVVEYL